MTHRVEVLDVSRLPYEERLTASALQGIVNRDGPRMFLDHGTYDDPGTRRTNSVMMREEDWFGKYREYLKRNDLDVLDYYCSVVPMEIEHLGSLDAAIRGHASSLKGLVVWDPAVPDTVNLALTLAGLGGLLVVHPSFLDRARKAADLPVVEDLRGRFSNRAALYTWAFARLFPLCRAGRIACFEPEWRRSEFADYIVQNRLFAYCLSSFEKGGPRSIGQKLLLLLIAGPIGLRNLLYGLHLDAAVRRLAVALLAVGSPEVRLHVRIQRAVSALPLPTLFGWHSQADDELAFMALLSADGLRLVPSFMAGNFSFHSQVPNPVPLRQRHVETGSVTLDPRATYLTFVLSDGDQLTLMNTAELGNWRMPSRGTVPFSWECQPLLVEIAPALLGFYYRNRTENDLLVAGPSGAGYVIPPLVPRLPAYLAESARLCDAADIRVVTSYNGDIARRVLRDIGRAPGRLIGNLAGYFHLGRTPARLAGKRPFVAYAWPHLDQIGLDAAATLDGIRALIDAPGPRPRFLACHLFAYRTTVADVAAFVATLDRTAVKVVRADELLAAAQIHLATREGAHER